MHRVRIKICGITTASDGAAAAHAGADAIGLVFYPDSPRAVSVDAARAIGRALPPFVARAALFLDATDDEVRHVIKHVRPDVLQFHGREASEFCRGFGMPYMKSVPMGEENIDLDAWAETYADAQGLLLDANRAGEAGGRGQTFDWAAQSKRPDLPLVVAGGLSVDNVAQAIRQFAPYAVDVSSGVESAPGVKDQRRMQDFAAAVVNSRG